MAKTESKIDRIGNVKSVQRGRGHLSPAKARKEAWKKIIVDFYIKGHTMEEVARLAEEATGGHRFTPVVVSKYVNEAIEKWRVQKDAMMENHKAIELQKINRLETEYWNAWEVSRQIMKSKSTIKNKDSEGGKLKVATVRDDEKPSAGDAQFLRGIQWCIDKRCLILGIEVPQLQPPAGPVTTNNNITYIRRVVFKTRETTSAPQVIEQPTNSEE